VRVLIILHFLAVRVEKYGEMLYSLNVGERTMMWMKRMPSEKKIRSVVKYDCDFLTVVEDDVLLPGGKEGKRVVVKHIGAASVLPITKDNDVILVRQHRYATGGDTLEIPAGKKDYRDEDGIQCARRELEEETGYTASVFEKLQDVYTAIGFSDERIEIFVARDATRMNNPPEGDDDEYVEIVVMPLKKAIELAKQGEIVDSKTALALLSVNV